jgi:hypothetical protein
VLKAKRKEWVAEEVRRKEEEVVEEGVEDSL